MPDLARRLEIIEHSIKKSVRPAVPTASQYRAAAKVG
jgi:hypothetical protein